MALLPGIKGESAFTESEITDIQARLLLTDKTFGGLVDDSRLLGYLNKRTAQTRDERGHNWELLRQRAEAESLYFEPLTMPDGSATMLCFGSQNRDLTRNHGASYNGRF